MEWRVSQGGRVDLVPQSESMAALTASHARLICATTRYWPLPSVSLRGYAPRWSAGCALCIDPVPNKDDNDAERLARIDNLLEEYRVKHEDLAAYLEAVRDRAAKSRDAATTASARKKTRLNDR